MDRGDRKSKERKPKLKSSKRKHLNDSDSESAKQDKKRRKTDSTRRRRKKEHKKAGKNSTEKRRMKDLTWCIEMQWAQLYSGREPLWGTSEERKFIWRLVHWNRLCNLPDQKWLVLDTLTDTIGIPQHGSALFAFEFWKKKKTLPGNWGIWLPFRMKIITCAICRHQTGCFNIVYLSSKAKYDSSLFQHYSLLDVNYGNQANYHKSTRQKQWPEQLLILSTSVRPCIQDIIILYTYYVLWVIFW